MRVVNYAGIAFALGAICSAQQRAIAPKVVMGDSHGVWLKADGTVWVWGGNSDAYLPAKVPALTGVRDVAAGDLFSAAVASDGTLWTWTNSEARPTAVTSLKG